MYYRKEKSRREKKAANLKLGHYQRTGLISGGEITGLTRTARAHTDATRCMNKIILMDYLFRGNVAFAHSSFPLILSRLTLGG